MDGVSSGASSGMKRRILVDISAHGFGHVAQTSPVVNALFRRFHGLEVFVRSGLPILEGRLECPFEWINRSVDLGIVMKNAVDVDAAATASAYLAFHENWKKRVDDEAKWLGSMAFDLVLCNAPYLPLQAASLADIPSVALCSLNWADLYMYYCSSFPGSDTILGEMLEAYKSAAVFLRVEPGMPMDWAGGDWIGPVAVAGKDGRNAIRKRLGLKQDEKLA
ncbi:MAG TPA: hypothetical protein PLK99_12765, partial [Burkholderiales bacterium]|nr:hypothetical protein [Burkholderiales bacterium]